MKALAALLLLVANNASGFTFLFEGKNRHLDLELTFYAGISQLAPDGRSFNDAFEDAALDWQSQTRISIGVIKEYLDPCTDTTPTNLPWGKDDKHSIDMTPDICGQSDFGPYVATAHPGGTSPRGPNPGDIDGGDIYFNNTDNWDIYDGPAQHNAIDFRWVALHEIGHILGLYHTIFPAEIMSGAVTDADVLYPDDLCGIAILYEVPEDCTMLLEGATTLSGKATSDIHWRRYSGHWGFLRQCF